MKLHYFEIRGLGEMIRLALEASGTKYEEVPIDYNTMKEDLECFHFGQCPRLDDGDLSICQSQAIMRHLGRKFQMYGTDDVEASRIDELLDGAFSLRLKYLDLIYQHQAEDEAKAEHWAKHGNPPSAHTRCGGAHWRYLSTLLKRGTAGGRGPAVGSTLSIADVALAELTSLYLRLFAEQMRSTYPELVAHCEWVYGMDGIKTYVESGKRKEKINANGRG